jgi:hypothetical protein
MRKGCDELADVAEEMALGVLTGRERAAAIAHLEHCARCREKVRRLMVTEDELLGLLPVSDPPPGFEGETVERLGLAVPKPVSRAHRRYLVLTVAAMLLAVIMLGLGVRALWAATSPGNGIGPQLTVSRSR